MYKRQLVEGLPPQQLAKGVLPPPPQQLAEGLPPLPQQLADGLPQLPQQLKQVYYYDPNEATDENGELHIPSIVYDKNGTPIDLQALPGEVTLLRKSLLRANYAFDVVTHDKITDEG